MPDHQIVIKLSKDRFDEAQRRARDAGFRSATSYIREKIESFIDNPEELKSALEEARLIVDQELLDQIRQVDDDLMRMQQELQVFISETEELHEEFPLETLDSFEFKENFGSIPELPEFTDSTGATMEEPKTSRENTTDDTTSDTKNSTKFRPDVTTSHAITIDTGSATISRSESTPLDEQEKNIWRTPTQSFSPEIPEEEEIQPSAEESPKVEIEEPQQPQIEEVLSAVDEAHDELEEMADRAFSISPRLGEIEEVKGVMAIAEDDPLADLLDENLVEVMKSGETVKLESRIIEQQVSKETEEPEDVVQESTAIPEEDNREEEESPASEQDSSPELEQDSAQEEAEEEDIEEAIDESSEEDEPEEAENNETDENRPSDMILLNGSEEDDELDEDDQDEPEDDVQKHDLSSGPPPKRKK